MDSGAESIRSFAFCLDYCLGRVIGTTELRYIERRISS